MKNSLKIISVLGCLLLSTQLFSQDYIVTWNNDTINCRIIDIEKNHLRFQTTKDGKETVNYIKMENILSFKANEHITNRIKEYNNKQQVIEEMPVLESDKEEITSDKAYKELTRIALGGGYSKRLGKVMKTGVKELDQLSKDARNGFALEVDLAYYPRFRETNSINYGVALNFSYVNSSANAENFYIIDPQTNKEKYVHDYKEKQNIFYVGPSFSMLWDYNEWMFTGNIGLGVGYYINHFTTNGSRDELTSTFVSSLISFSGEYKVSSQLGLGLKLSLSGGSFEKGYLNGIKAKMSDRMSAYSLLLSGIISYNSF